MRVVYHDIVQVVEALQDSLHLSAPKKVDLDLLVNQGLEFNDWVSTDIL